MSTENKNVLPASGGGEIVFQTKSHWFVFLPWLGVSLFLTAMAVMLIISILNNLLTLFPGIFIASFFATIGIIACAFESICRIALFVTAEYSVLSDGRLLIRGQFLGKIIEDIFLADIIAVNLLSYNKELDCGTVVIMTNDGKGHKLREIKSPEKFMDYIVNY